MEPNANPIYHASTELADLGSARFDHDTAAISDRDFSLRAPQHKNAHNSSSATDPRALLLLSQARAPQGLESQVFAWNTFQYTTEERDDRAELKADLHEGQLHRQNRVVAQAMAAQEGYGDTFSHGMGRGDGGRGRGRGRGAVGITRGAPMRGGIARGGMSIGSSTGYGAGGASGAPMVLEPICVARKPPGKKVMPLAKGIPEELDKSLFWDGPITGV